MGSYALVDEVEMLLDGTWEDAFSSSEDVIKRYELKMDNGGSGSGAYC